MSTIWGLNEAPGASTAYAEADLSLLTSRRRAYSLSDREGPAIFRLFPERRFIENLQDHQCRRVQEIATSLATRGDDGLVEHGQHPST